MICDESHRLETRARDETKEEEEEESPHTHPTHTKAINGEREREERSACQVFGSIKRKSLIHLGGIGRWQRDRQTDRQAGREEKLISGGKSRK